ncbi:MAG: hypothetical protein ACRELD_08980 [Longimicrobiales bacterium]
MSTRREKTEMALATDQIRDLARRLAEEADGRVHESSAPTEHQRLWEVARHACHAVAAVAELEREELARAERAKRARYVVTELEIALDAAKRTRAALRLREDGDVE